MAKPKNATPTDVDWRVATLARMRALIQAAVPKAVEEIKWGDVPTWSLDGILCTGETYRSVVKLTFAKGAQLQDPKKLFNASLEGNLRRAIDIREGEKVNEAAFRALIREAATVNAAHAKTKTRPPAKARTRKK